MHFIFTLLAQRLPLLRDANLLWLVQFNLKQRSWAQCCFVYSINGQTAIFTAPKAAPSGKEWICFFIQTVA